VSKITFMLKTRTVSASGVMKNKLNSRRKQNIFSYPTDRYLFLFLSISSFKFVFSERY